jgi:hypothetical protein
VATPVVAIGLFCAVLSLAFLIVGISTVRKRHVLGGAFGVLLALLLLALAALCGIISAASQGYRALTREEVAATVHIQRTRPDRFTARFVFPDGREEVFNLAGNEIYVDAHILKWKPIVNVLGLHTAYELDRVAGRYTKLDDERDNIRTVFALSRQKSMNMYDLREHFPLLRLLLDTEYGSATFVPAEGAAPLEIRVSTTGLLVRKAAPEI